MNKIEIRRKNLLEALLKDWNYNPKFIEVLFHLTDENLNNTDRILEELDANEDFVEDIKKYGFKQGMTNLLILASKSYFFGYLEPDELFENVLPNHKKGMKIPSIL